MTRDTPSKATRHFFFRLETREVGSEPLHTCNFYALLLRQQQGTKKRKTVQPTYSPPFGVSAWVTLRPFFALIVCSALFFCFNWFSSFAPSPSLCVCACVSARTLTCICFFFLPPSFFPSLSLFVSHRCLFHGAGVSYFLSRTQPLLPCAQSVECLPACVHKHRLWLSVRRGSVGAFSLLCCLHASRFVLVIYDCLRGRSFSVVMRISPPLFRHSLYLFVFCSALAHL